MKRKDIFFKQYILHNHLFTSACQLKLTECQLFLCISIMDDTLLQKWLRHYVDILDVTFESEADRLHETMTIVIDYTKKYNFKALLYACTVL